MNNNITNFEDSQEVISWKYEDQEIIKKGPQNTKLHGIKLKASNRVLILYLCNALGANNAIIYNPDGSEYKVIKSPIEHSIGFADAYYTGDLLTLICWFNKKETVGFLLKKAIIGQDCLACIYDENGNFIRMHETR